MLHLKTKGELAKDSFTLAQGHSLVRYRSVTYVPADYETRDTDVPPDPDRTIWLPLDRLDIQRMAARQFDTLFANDSELSNFNFMVAQNAIQQEKEVTSLLVRTPTGLKELEADGQLVNATGDFRPNALVPMLNEDPAEKQRILDVISGWLDSEEEATSLLSHLATSLAPGWSAVKYVLLLGEGRNGKGTLLKMLQDVFGRENISNVTRQAMAEEKPVVTELNGKLLNIIYDGRAEYLKDSGTEKSLVAGEPVPIRKLYESASTTVQTNSLFIEALNHEPKTKDKSTALQKRLVRFHFPNIYPLNHKFERTMRTEEALGAFLSLLIDHYVCEDEVATRLAPTTRSIELQLEQMYANSLGLQFLKYLEETDALGAVDAVLGSSMHELAQKFQAWRLKENDISTWAEPDVLAQFTPLLNTERKSVRAEGKVRKIRVVTSLKAEADAFIHSLKGTDDDADILSAVVED